MSRRLLLALAVGATLASGCVVEPRRVDSPTGADASVTDSGPAPDAAAPDAAPLSCRWGEVTCPEGTYCTDDGVCAPLPGTCKLTSDCQGGEACVDGACARPPRSCRSASDCASPEVCLAAGWCALPAASVVPLVAGCTVDADCGPGGLCAGGACSSCSDSLECTGGLECNYDTGVCKELERCADASGCFAGDLCVSGSCKRTMDACTYDADNDVAPEPLTDAYHGGLSICGEDEDRYSIALDADLGALIAITSTRSQATLKVEYSVANDDPRLMPARLDLPGLTLIGIPAYQAARDVDLTVTSADTSGAYAIDVRQVTGLCAGDALDLYGDGAPASAPVVPVGSTLPLVACLDDADHVRVDVAAGEVLRVVASFGAEATDAADLDVELLDGMGTALASGTSPSPTTEEVTWTAPTAQQVTVRVTAKRGPTAGVPYDLAISTGETRAEACTTPAGTLSLASPTATGTFVGAANLGAPDCADFAPAARRDRIYAIVPPTADSVITLSVKQTSGDDANLSVGLLTRCVDDASARTCASSAFPYYAATVELRPGSADPIYAIVSSDGPNESVDFELTASFIPVSTPANDVCTAATALVGSTTLDVPTFGAADDARLTASSVCGAAGTGSGPDRFYALSLGAGERAALELRGAPGGFLWVGTDCAALTTTCTVADALLEAHPARVALRPSQATSYVVAVDGVGAGSEGDYQLLVVRSPELECLEDADCAPALRCDDYRCAAAPANDRCPGASVTLVDGRATLQGSTGAASDDFGASCASATGQADVVYAVTVPAGARALVARVTAADWDPVLSVRQGTCDAESAEVACADDVSARLPAVEVASPAAGTYYVVVDAYAGRGAFTLELAVE